MEHDPLPSRRALRDRESARLAQPEGAARPEPSRRRHRGRLRRRPYAAVAVVVPLVAAASAVAYRAAVLSDRSSTLVPTDVLRHALTAVALAVAVLAQGAQLRAANRPALAALLPTLVVAVPLTVELTGTVRLWSSGAVNGMLNDVQVWIVDLPYPGLVAAAALLVADGVRSTWTRSTVFLTVLIVAATATAAAARPRWVEPVSGWDVGPLRAVVVGMTVCAAVIASCDLPVRSRWTRALGCAVPAMALAIVPTLVTTPAALDPTQRWTVVIYPLACLAAACLAVLLVGWGELLGRLRGHPETA